jgi:hypothetical protein
VLSAITKTCLTLCFLTALPPAAGAAVEVAVAGAGTAAGPAAGPGDDAGGALGDGPPELTAEAAGESATGEPEGAPLPAPRGEATAVCLWITTRRWRAARTADWTLERPIAEAMISAVATADSVATAASCGRVSRIV